MSTARWAFAVLALAACADDGNDSAASGWSPYPATPGEPGVTSATADVTTVEAEPTGSVVAVIALDNSFRPEFLEVSVGDEVRWENRGMNEHDVLYVDGDDWGVEVAEFQPGDVYGHVFTEPGEYRYYCSIHGNAEVGMTGTVVVTG